MGGSNYEQALERARSAALEDLRGRDLRDAAFRSGAVLEAPGRLSLRFLDRDVTVLPAEGRILDRDADVPPRTAVLLLHYLLRASGRPLTGRRVSFREIPQGDLYFRPFRQRVILPLGRRMEQDAEAVARAAAGFAEPASGPGDLALAARPLPYVPVHYHWYRGEEGIPWELTVLFDASAPDYLSTEDLVVLCEEINRRVAQRLKEAP